GCYSHGCVRKASSFSQRLLLLRPAASSIHPHTSAMQNPKDKKEGFHGAISGAGGVYVRGLGDSGEKPAKPDTGGLYGGTETRRTAAAWLAEFRGLRHGGGDGDAGQCLRRCICRRHRGGRRVQKHQNHAVALRGRRSRGDEKGGNERLSTAREVTGRL